MPSSARTAMRFRRLRLRNWRNFVDIDVELQRRAFLVGANASGKSNLLDVFRFLRDMASPGGFEHAVWSRGGVSRIRSLAASRQPSVEIAVAVGDDADEWEYLLRFGQDGKENPVVEAEQVRHGGKLILNRPNATDRADGELLTQTHLQQIAANGKFRDLADFFSSVSYLHVVPQSIRETGVLPARANDQYGSDLIERIASTHAQTRKERLRRIRDALKVAVPQLIGLELDKDGLGVPHLWGKYENWRARGVWQNEQDFSDGTLRLLGLLWSTLEPGGPLLLEEPELSLHPGIVEYVPQMLARMQLRTGRQTLISTHSPELLRDGGIGLDEVLILEPGEKGACVHTVSRNPELCVLVKAGVPLDDVVLPETRPRDISQLASHVR